MIYLGADHAGYKLKEVIKKYLLKQNIPFKDLSAPKINQNDDYPIIGKKVALKVSQNIGKDPNTKGILICGSSFGVCIAANKIKEIRAVSISTTKEAKISRQHNDANILCLSGWNLKVEKAKKIIEVWLKTPFSNESRHKRRIEQIRKLEK